MLLISLLGAVLISILYVPIINSYFLGEDYAWWKYVKGKSLVEVLRYFIASPSEGLAGFYHPLVGSSYWLNVNTSWMNPFWFHLTNLIFHFGTYLLVVSLGLFFCKKKSVAMLSGVFFLLFPFQIEAVGWIDGRHDLIMTFFYLLSFFFFVLWHDRKNWIYPVASLVSFGLSLMSKETAVSLPLLLVAVIVYDAKEKDWKHIVEALRTTSLFWLTLAGYGVLHAFYVGKVNPFSAASHLSLTVPRVTILYLIFLVMVLALFFLLRGKIRKTERHFLNLSLLFAILMGITYLPAAFTFTQERYLYLPSTMATVFASVVVFLVFSRKAIQGHAVRKVTYIIIVFLGCVLSYGYLRGKVNDWEIGSSLAKQMVSEFRVQADAISDDATVFLVNLPDNYHGSYIFRTHASEAFQYGSQREFSLIVVTPSTLGTGRSEIKDNKEGVFQLKSSDGYLVFPPSFTDVTPSGEPFLETGVYRVTVRDTHALELELKQRDEETYIFVADSQARTIRRIPLQERNVQQKSGE